MSVTILQAEMLKKIAESGFSPTNGKPMVEFDGTCSVWADTVIETRQDKGVFTTLLTAGLVMHTGLLPNGKRDPDAGVALTRVGFDEYRRFFYK